MHQQGSTSCQPHILHLRIHGRNNTLREVRSRNQFQLMLLPTLASKSKPSQTESTQDAFYAYINGQGTLPLVCGSEHVYWMEALQDAKSIIPQFAKKNTVMSDVWKSYTDVTACLQ